MSAALELQPRRRRPPNGYVGITKHSAIFRGFMEDAIVEAEANPAIARCPGHRAVLVERLMFMLTMRDFLDVRACSTIGGNIADGRTRKTVLRGNDAAVDAGELVAFPGRGWQRPAGGRRTTPVASPRAMDGFRLLDTKRRRELLNEGAWWKLRREVLAAHYRARGLERQAELAAAGADPWEGAVSGGTQVAPLPPIAAPRSIARVPESQIRALPPAAPPARPALQEVDAQFHQRPMDGTTPMISSASEIGLVDRSGSRARARATGKESPSATPSNAPSTAPRPAAAGPPADRAPAKGNDGRAAIVTLGELAGGRVQAMLELAQRLQAQLVDARAAGAAEHELRVLELRAALAAAERSRWFLIGRELEAKRCGRKFDRYRTNLVVSKCRADIARLRKELDELGWRE